MDTYMSLKVCCQPCCWEIKHNRPIRACMEHNIWWAMRRSARRRDELYVHSMWPHWPAPLRVICLARDYYYVITILLLYLNSLFYTCIKVRNRPLSAITYLRRALDRRTSVRCIDGLLSWGNRKPRYYYALSLDRQERWNLYQLLISVHLWHSTISMSMGSPLQQQDNIRRIRVYRNGDDNFFGKDFVLNPRQVRNYEAFLQRVTDHVQLNEAARVICTPVHGTRIRSLEDVQDRNDYVAVGHGKFKNIGYVCLI